MTLKYFYDTLITPIELRDIPENILGNVTVNTRLKLMTMKGGDNLDSLRRRQIM